MGDSSLLGIIIFLATVVGKFVEVAIGKFLESRGTSASDKDALKKDVDRMLEWHDVRDADGTPVWYFPKNEMFNRLDELETLIRQVKEDIRRHDRKNDKD